MLQMDTVGSKVRPGETGEEREVARRRAGETIADVNTKFLKILASISMFLVACVVAAMIYFVVTYDLPKEHAKHVPQAVEEYYQLTFKLLGLFFTFVILSLSVLVGLALWIVGSGKKEMTDEFRWTIDSLYRRAESQLGWMIEQARDRVGTKAVEGVISERAQEVLGAAKGKQMIVETVARVVRDALTGKVEGIAERIIEKRHQNDIATKVVQALTRKFGGQLKKLKMASSKKKRSKKER